MTLMAIRRRTIDGREVVWDRGMVDSDGVPIWQSSCLRDKSTITQSSSQRHASCGHPECRLDKKILAVPLIDLEHELCAQTEQTSGGC